MTGPWMALVLALTVLVIVLGVLVLGLLRRVMPLLESGRHGSLPPPALTGLAAGEKVPPFQAIEGSGPIDSAVLLAEPRVVLLMSPSCPPCRSLAAELREEPAVAGELSLLVVMEDSPESRAVQLPSGVRMLFERDREVSDAFRSTAVPQAFAVEAGGVVIRASGVAGIADLRALAIKLREGGEAAHNHSISMRT